MSQYCYSDAYEAPQHHVDYDNVYTHQYQGDVVGLNRQQIDVASPDSVDHIGYPPDTIGVQTINYPTGIMNDWSYVDTYQSGWLLQEYIGDGGIDTNSSQPYDHSDHLRPQQEHLLDRDQAGLMSGQEYQWTEDLTDPCKFVEEESRRGVLTSKLRRRASIPFSGVPSIYYREKRDVLCV